MDKPSIRGRSACERVQNQRQCHNSMTTPTPTQKQAHKDTCESERFSDFSKPDYLPPTLRDGLIITQFVGAVRTRIASRQRALWSRFIGAGFTAEDIGGCWPEANMRFLSLKYGGDWRQTNIDDLNLRELDELLKYLEETYPAFAITHGSPTSIALATKGTP